MGSKHSKYHASNKSNDISKNKSVDENQASFIKNVNYISTATLQGQGKKDRQIVKVSPFHSSSLTAPSTSKFSTITSNSAHENPSIMERKGLESESQIHSNRSLRGSTFLTMVEKSGHSRTKISPSNFSRQSGNVQQSIDLDLVSDTQSTLTGNTFLDFDIKEQLTIDENRILNLESSRSSNEKDSYEIAFIATLKFKLMQLILNKFNSMDSNGKNPEFVTSLDNVLGQVERDFSVITSYVNMRQRAGKLVSGRVHRWFKKVSADADAQNLDIALLKVRKTVYEIEKKQQRRNERDLNRSIRNSNSSKNSSDDNQSFPESFSSPNTPSSARLAVRNHILIDDIAETNPHQKQLVIPRKLSNLAPSPLVQNQVIYHKQIHRQDNQSNNEDNFDSERMNLKLESSGKDKIQLFATNPDFNNHIIDVGHFDTPNIHKKSRRNFKAENFESRDTNNELVDTTIQESVFMDQRVINSQQSPPVFNENQMNSVDFPVTNLHTEQQKTKIEHSEETASQFSSKINNKKIHSIVECWDEDASPALIIEEINKICANHKVASNIVHQLKHNLEDYVQNEESNSSGKIIAILYQLAAFTEKMGQLEEATGYYNQLLHSISFQTQPNAYIFSLLGLSRIMKLSGKLRKSKSILERRILKDLFKNNHTDVPSTIRYELYGLLGSICEDLNQEHKATKYFNLQNQLPANVNI